jgi:hypothetical protein
VKSLNGLSLGVVIRAFRHFQQLFKLYNVDYQILSTPVIGICLGTLTLEMGIGGTNPRL